MKVRVGVNPDWADYDELDEDALDALAEFDNGTLGYEELRTLIGDDAAKARVAERYGEDPDDLFDDPYEL